MNLLKKYNFIFRFVLFLIIIALFQTIINLILPINNSINQLFSLFFLTIYIFVENIKKGKKIERKAYIEGLKTGLMYILVLYLLGLPFGLFKLPVKRLLYFLTIIVISITSSIIGINKKTLR